MKTEKQMSKSIIKAVIMIVLAAIVIMGIYMILVTRSEKAQTDEEEMSLTDVQKITTLNLKKSYPSSERDVVSLYGEITKTMYNCDYSDEEFNEMEEKLEGIFDEELLSNQKNFKESLKTEINQKKTDGYTLQSCVVCDKDSVVYNTIDGKDCAQVDCLFSIRHTSKLEATYYSFILRKDDEGLWKIFGWTVDTGDSSDSAE